MLVVSDGGPHLASEYNYVGLKPTLVDSNMRTVLGSQSDRQGTRWIWVRGDIDESTPQVKNERLALEDSQGALVNREQSHDRGFTMDPRTAGN